MPYRDPRCVYITDNLGTADVVATWLDQQGFPAKVMNRATLGGLLGLTVFSTTGVSADAVEVWVLQEEHIEPALEALAEQDDFQAKKDADKAALGPVDAVCEECGATSTFAATDRGTVQDCPKCGEYLDVPGDDDEFEWLADHDQMEP